MSKIVSAGRPTTSGVTAGDACTVDSFVIYALVLGALVIEASETGAFVGGVAARVAGCARTAATSSAPIEDRNRVRAL
jgi:hypothetical protein